MHGLHHLKTTKSISFKPYYTSLCPADAPKPLTKPSPSCWCSNQQLVITSFLRQEVTCVNKLASTVTSSTLIQINFHEIFNKLDKRAAAKPSHQPRTNRELGSPVEKSIPPMCKKWMMKSALRKGQNEIEKEFDSSVSELDSSVSELDEEGTTEIGLIYSIVIC